MITSHHIPPWIAWAFCLTQNPGNPQGMLCSVLQGIRKNLCPKFPPLELFQDTLEPWGPTSRAPNAACTPHHEAAKVTRHVAATLAASFLPPTLGGVDGEKVGQCVGWNTRATRVDQNLWVVGTDDLEEMSTKKPCWRDDNITSNCSVLTSPPKYQMFLKTSNVVLSCQ